ncbi:hypothetical protein BV22DRAFT_1019673, partial [Leucogyrophana mollusca]
WDEDCHGPMGIRSDRRSYPDNFLWSCCTKITRAKDAYGGSIPLEGGASKKRRRG